MTDNIKLDTQELRAIIFIFQKIDSEKYLKGRNGMYLDHYEKQLLKKFQNILAERCKVKVEDLFQV